MKHLIRLDKSIEINTRRLAVPGAVESLTELIRAMRTGRQVRDLGQRRPCGKSRGHAL